MNLYMLHPTLVYCIQMKGNSEMLYNLLWGVDLLIKFVYSHSISLLSYRSV